MNVLLHRDFSPQKQLVAIDLSNEKEWELSGIVDWDGGEVAPVEVTYNCPDGSGPTMMKVLLEVALTRKIGILFNDDCREIEKRFLRRSRSYYQGSWK
jgi:hypothetical protein